MTLEEVKTQLEKEIAEIEQAKAGLDDALLKKNQALTAVESTIAAAGEGAGTPPEPEESGGAED